jgi:hypothetical protein
MIMPIERCRENNKPGYKWGKKGNKCYVYDPNNKASETKARKKAHEQGIASGEFFREAYSRLQEVYKKMKGKK